MVKTRRSNGENGEVEDVNCTVNGVGETPDEKVKCPVRKCVFLSGYAAFLLCIETH